MTIILIIYDYYINNVEQRESGINERGANRRRGSSKWLVGRPMLSDRELALPGGGEPKLLWNRENVVNHLPNTAVIH